MEAVDGTALSVTVFVCALGLAVLLWGLGMFLRSRRLSARCTELAEGTITAIVDEDFKWSRRRAAKSAQKLAEEPVVAANDAIAAKKRSYREKKRAAAQAQTQAAASTWRPLVTYDAGGRTIEVRATRAVGQGRFKVGQPCKVHYDPNKPEYHWLAIDGLPRSFGLMLMACGGGLILIGVACWFVIPELSGLSMGAMVGA